MSALSLKPDHRTLTSATADVLREAILHERFPAGSQLPPEMELIEMLGISRATLREALRALEEQGFIVRKRGLGTYVREQSIIKDLSINFGITEMISQGGYRAGFRDLVIRTDAATGAIATALGLKEEMQILRIERVRTANDRPVVWSMDALSMELLGKQAISQAYLEAHSLYAFLEENLQMRVARGVAQLYPAAASREMAQRLSIPKGSPLMRLTQTDYDTNDRPILYSIEYHLPDAFVFLINRKGPHW